MKTILVLLVVLAMSAIPALAGDGYDGCGDSAYGSSEDCPMCQEDTDCDDQNECTVDICDGYMCYHKEDGSCNDVPEFSGLAGAGIAAAGAALVGLRLKLRK